MFNARIATSALQYKVILVRLHNSVFSSASASHSILKTFIFSLLYLFHFLFSSISCSATMSYSENTPQFPNQPLENSDCTSLICPVERSGWGYLPSLAFAVIPLAGFILITLGHGFAGIKYRTWPFGMYNPSFEVTRPNHKSRNRYLNVPWLPPRSSWLPWSHLRT